MANVHSKLRFKVVPSARNVVCDPNTVFLVDDDWDDWFTYATTYQVWICVEDSRRCRLGSIKIGQLNMEADQRRADLPQEFSALDERFFSLGQEPDYYEALNQRGADFRNDFLQSLNDIAANLELWEQVKELNVTRRSLLRGISHSEVEGQLHRMTEGGAKLTSFNFTYRGPKRDARDANSIELSFDVEPESFPPTNVHVLIGRNGVGKTHTMNLMTKALVAKSAIAAQSGSFVTTDGWGEDTAGSPFSNLVSVCFSAFDRFLLRPDDLGEDNVISFSYVGLRRFGRQGNLTRSPESLATEFVKSAVECSVGSRKARWITALDTLE